MSTVQRKKATSKKARIDRRILAKARREDVEEPVSEGIRRAAEKIGATPSESAKASAAGLMTPEQWEKAIAHADANGGPLYAEMARLSQRFDNELGDIGHCVATTLAVLQVAGCSARTPIEVHLLTKKFVGAMIDVQLDGCLDPAVEGGAS